MLLNVSQNVYVKNMQDIDIDDRFNIIVDDLIKECSNRFDYQSSYAYDKHVKTVMSKINYDDFDFQSNIMNSNKRYFIYKIVRNLLVDKMDNNDWYDGAYAAFRSIECSIAYSTPGFLEAKNNSINCNN